MKWNERWMISTFQKLIIYCYYRYVGLLLWYCGSLLAPHMDFRFGYNMRALKFQRFTSESLKVTSKKYLPKNSSKLWGYHNMGSMSMLQSSHKNSLNKWKQTSPSRKKRNDKALVVGFCFDLEGGSAFPEIVGLVDATATVETTGAGPTPGELNWRTGHSDGENGWKTEKLLAVSCCWQFHVVGHFCWGQPLDNLRLNMSFFGKLSNRMAAAESLHSNHRNADPTKLLNYLFY